MNENLHEKAKRGDISNKDDLLRVLLYESNYTRSIHAGIQGDTDVSKYLDDDFESEISELIRE